MTRPQSAGSKAISSQVDERRLERQRVERGFTWLVPSRQSFAELPLNWLDPPGHGLPTLTALLQRWKVPKIAF